jgi:hypothetical protein
VDAVGDDPVREDVELEIEVGGERGAAGVVHRRDLHREAWRDAGTLPLRLEPRVELEREVGIVADADQGRLGAWCRLDARWRRDGGDYRGRQPGGAKRACDDRARTGGQLLTQRPRLARGDDGRREPLRREPAERLELGRSRKLEPPDERIRVRC